MAYYSRPRNWGCRLQVDGTYRGMRTVVLQNESLRVTVLADKGTDVLEFLYKPLDLDFTWLSPLGVRNPLVGLPSATTPLATFMENYQGGWQEILPNGGPPNRVGGAEYGQHAEVSLVPWDYSVVRDAPEEVAVVFSIQTAKVPFRLEKRLTLRTGSACLEVEEQLHNESEVAVPVMWGHHLAFGAPFLHENCCIEMPQGTVIIPHGEIGLARRFQDRRTEWPMAVAPDGSSLDLSRLPPPGTPTDMAYLQVSEGRYRVYDESRRAGLQVEWDRNLLPYVWYWQEFGATRSYPWYGRCYVVGLEPFSSYPTSGLSAAVENGTALVVPGSANVSLRLKISVV